MESNFESRILLCASCNEEFAFTVEAQEYFMQKGLADDPQMCKSCYTESKRVKRTETPEVEASRSIIDGSNVNGNVNVNGNRKSAK